MKKWTREKSKPKILQQAKSMLSLFQEKFISAGVAQLVEQLICNQSVMSSSLFTSYLLKYVIIFFRHFF